MTKAQLSQKILRIIGINSRFTEADPTQVEDVIGYLNDWMLANDGIGIRLGWIVDADPSSETGIPDWAVLGVTNSMAILCCAYFDKAPHPSISMNAAIGMQTILNNTVQTEQIQYPNRMPRGHGNRTLYSNKYYHPTDVIVTDNDLLEDSGGEVITS